MGQAGSGSGRRYREGMSLKIAELRALSDADVIARYDQHAEHAVVGIDYWMGELERRSRDRAERANSRLARASVVLSVGERGDRGRGAVRRPIARRLQRLPRAGA